MDSNFTIKPKAAVPKFTARNRSPARPIETEPSATNALRQPATAGTGGASGAKIIRRMMWWPTRRAELLDSMSSGISTIQAASNGITSITKLVQSSQSLISQAQQTTDTTVRAGPATQFTAVLGQVTQLARDAGFNGINLLDSTASANLTVTLNESGSSSVTVNAVNFTATGLAINNANNN